MSIATTTKCAAILACAVGLLGATANVMAQQIEPKIKPNISSTNKLGNTANVSLPGKVDMKAFNRSVSGLDSLSGQLDRALGDFKAQHSQTIGVARQLVTQDNQCYDRIYGRGDISAAERRASCPSGTDEGSCKLAVFKRCRSRFVDDYELSLAELEVRRLKLQCLLYNYGQGASAGAQANLLGMPGVRSDADLLGLPDSLTVDFSYLERISGCD